MLGYDVLFVDTDVALLQDPMSYFMYENIDFIHSVNMICRP